MEAYTSPNTPAPHLSAVQSPHPLSRRASRLHTASSPRQTHPVPRVSLEPAPPTARGRSRLASPAPSGPRRSAEAPPAPPSAPASTSLLAVASSARSIDRHRPIHGPQNPQRRGRCRPAAKRSVSTRPSNAALEVEWKIASRHRARVIPRQRAMPMDAEKFLASNSRVCSVQNASRASSSARAVS